MKNWPVIAVLLPLLVGLSVGCKRAQADSPNAAILGEWKVAAPMIGESSIAFDEKGYVQRFPKQSGAGKPLMRITGDYVFTGDHLIFTPKRMIVGLKSTTITQSGEGMLGPFDFTVTRSTPDLLYLNGQSKGEFGSTKLTWALYRNGAKPDPKLLDTSFEIHSQPGGWQVKPTGTTTTTTTGSAVPMGPTPAQPEQQNPPASADLHTQPAPPPAPTTEPAPSTTGETAPPPQEPPKTNPNNQPMPEQTPPATTGG